MHKASASFLFLCYHNSSTISCCHGRCCWGGGGGCFHHKMRSSLSRRHVCQRIRFGFVLFFISLTLFIIHMDTDQIPSLRSEMKGMLMYPVRAVDGRLGIRTQIFLTPFFFLMLHHKRVKCTRYDIVIKQWCWYHKYIFQ